jgi:hypothetical protein
MDIIKTIFMLPMPEQKVKHLGQGSLRENIYHWAKVFIFLARPVLITRIILIHTRIPHKKMNSRSRVLISTFIRGFHMHCRINCN